MAFQSERIEGDNYYMDYDIYTKKTWSSDGPNKKHTFTFDLDNISALSSSGLPLLLNCKDGEYYFATAQYEKPYFDPNVPFYEEPVVQPDNNLVIALYDSNFTKKSETKIAVPTSDSYLYMFPILGGFSYTDDLSLGVFGKDPVYIVTFQNYINSEDYVESYYVYNQSGEKVKTIYENASSMVEMSDIAGQEAQYCFYGTYNDVTSFIFVDVPSCEIVNVIPQVYDGITFSGYLDRCADGKSYQIALAMSNGETQDDETVTTKVAWFNADGSLDHYDTINLGKNVAMAYPYIEKEALSPYLFNTDEAREYMYLVKYYTSSSGSNTEEHLVIFNTEGNVLLDLGPDSEAGSISVITPVNLDNNPQLAVSYVSDDWKYTLNFYDLPLSKFAAGGDGTQANPYLISSAGDFMQIASAPAAYYKLINDIDFNGLSWAGVTSSFTGNLDGDNHVVKGLVLTGNGIFEEITSIASVSNLIFDSPEMVSPDYYAGFIAGTAIGETETSAPTVTNVHILNPVINVDDYSSTFGGIIGNASSYTSVVDCSVENAEFTLSNANVGGIIGNMRTSASVKATLFSGNITGKKNIGGIAGSTTSGDEVISDCHVNASLKGEEVIGGVVGSSRRSTIKNCVVEGSLAATKAGDCAVGGVVGSLTALSYGTATTIVSKNIVSLDAISVPASEDNITAHRVIGHSSIDESEIDWDNDDFDWDNWNGDTSVLPRIYGSAEEGLADNYVINTLNPVSSKVEAVATSTEGASIALNDVTSDFVTGLGFALGDNNAAPWVLQSLPSLYFENTLLAIEMNPTSLTLDVDYTKTVTITALGKADYTKFTVEQEGSENVFEIVETNVTENGIEVTLKGLAKGTAQLVAKCGNLSATCTVAVVPGSGVEGIEADTFAINYNGSNVYAEGASIAIYNVNGACVATGYNNVDVTELNAGIYVVLAKKGSEQATVKIAVK
jgi:hypothetical protein